MKNLKPQIILLILFIVISFVIFYILWSSKDTQTGTQTITQTGTQTVPQNDCIKLSTRMCPQNISKEPFCVCTGKIVDNINRCIANQRYKEFVPLSELLDTSKSTRQEQEEACKNKYGII